MKLIHKLILIGVLFAFIAGYLMGVEQLVATSVIIGIIAGGILKLFMIIIDDDHAPYD